MQAILLLLLAGIASYVFLVRKELAPRVEPAATPVAS
jgi:hypothetical protein